MKPKDHRLRVGITLTVFISLAFALIFSLDSTASWWSGHRTLRVIFPYVQGLRPNDPVQFQGVPCGRVLSLRIRSSTSPPGVAFAEEAAQADTSGCEVELTLEVPAEVFSHLRTHSRARIEKTLTGVTVVNLDQGHGLPLVERGEIIGVPSVTINHVTTELKIAAQHLTMILTDLSPMVRSLKTDGIIARAIGRVEEAGRETSALAASLRGVVEDNSESIRQVTNGTINLITNVSTTLPEVRALSVEARIVAKDLRSLTASLERWVRDARGSVDASVDNIKHASDNLRTLSAELERRPWRLLHAPNELEARELGLYDSISTFADGALHLRRSIDTVRIMLESEMDEELESALRNALMKLERDAEAYRAMQRTFWEKLQKLYEE